MQVTTLRTLTYCNTLYASGDRVEMEPDDAEQLESRGIVERFRPPSLLRKMMGAAPENKMEAPPDNKRKRK